MDNIQKAKSKAILNYNYDELMNEAKEYAGSEWDNLTKSEKEDLIEEMKSDRAEHIRRMDEGGEADSEREDEEMEEANERLEELMEEYDLPSEVIEEYASNMGVEIDDIRDLPFSGRYDSEEDFAEDLVEQGAISNLSYYLEMTSLDMRLLAQEEADARVDDMDDDDLLEAMDMEDEANEYNELKDEIYDLESDVDDLKNKLDDYLDEDDLTEGEMEMREEKAKEMREEIEEKENELENLQDKLASLDTYDEIVDKAREQLRDVYYDDIHDELERDAVGYFVDNLGYAEEDLAKNSAFSVDYEKLARDLSYDYTIIEHGGDVYVFASYMGGGMTYAKGGETDEKVVELTPIYTTRDKKGFRFYSAENGNKLYAEKNGEVYEVNEDTLKPTFIVNNIFLTRYKFVGLIDDSDVKDLHPLHYEREGIKRVRKSFGLKDGGSIYAKGGVHNVNKKYAYFAVNKKTNKIIDGWEIVDDVESLKYYAKMDLKDNDLNPSDYNLLSAKALKSRGIDPYSWDSWAKTGEYGDGGMMAKGGMTEHGLKNGDKIIGGKIIGTTIRVHNDSLNEDARIDLNTGERIVLTYNQKTKKWEDKMADGGKMAKGGVMELSANMQDVLDEMKEKYNADDYDLDVDKQEVYFVDGIGKEIKGSRISVKKIMANGGKMARGGEVRYKMAGRNFGEEIENSRKFRDALVKVYENQSGENTYPENFIREIALTGKIVKSDGSYYLKDYSYKGTITKFEFLDDKNFLNLLKYTNRPTIKSFKFEEGGTLGAGSFAKGGVTFDDKVNAIKKRLEGMSVAPKFRKEYGKTYDKTEALSAAKKIAGKMKAKEMSKKKS
jgi:hypothetical protein